MWSDICASVPGTGGMPTGKLWNCILTDFEPATGREARPLISVDTNSLRLGRTTLDFGLLCTSKDGRSPS